MMLTPLQCWNKLLADMRLEPFAIIGLPMTRGATIPVLRRLTDLHSQIV